MVIIIIRSVCTKERNLFLDWRKRFAIVNAGCYLIGSCFKYGAYVGSAKDRDVCPLSRHFFFLVLGVFLLFDKKLLAMGNFLFIFGFAMLSGARRTLEFFGFAGDRMVERWKTRWRGIVTFIGGIMLVCYGWTMIGMGVEMFGFLNLFGSFFPPCDPLF